MINHLIESVHLDNAAHDISQNVKYVSIVEIPEAAHTDVHSLHHDTSDDTVINE